ncbi:MAG: glycosyltransferase, partial [Chitinophagaceae bacterium]
MIAGFSMIILSAFLLLISVSYAALLLLYRSAWNRIPFYHSEDPPAKNPFISVIIPARNEAENLPALIRDLQLQQLPAECFEVLIVDDHSSDSTPEIVK